ncbi:MAG: 4Fe-4S dicluster domain-containing protein [Candidatus Omnitrophota bacterium]
MQYYLKNEAFSGFLALLSRKYQVFVPEKIGRDDYVLTRLPLNVPPEIIFNPYRTVEPLRSFLTYAKEEVGKSSKASPVCLVHIKGCDLFSLKIQDFVFLGGGSEDSFYRLRRENTLIISSDCTGFKEVCHCVALNIMPYPVELFDLNLSPINEGFIVTVGSKKGETLVKEAQAYFHPANSSQLTGVRLKREKLVEDLKRHITAQHLARPDILQQALKLGFDSKVWENETLTCVECGACNNICCTCHCFLLSDEKNDGQPVRTRTWDACQFPNFARVAGGVNPLKIRRQRLRNRYLKKFDFFPDNLGLNACTGCGRCIEACPAKIDIRRILKTLANEKSLPTY